MAAWSVLRCKSQATYMADRTYGSCQRVRSKLTNWLVRVLEIFSDSRRTILYHNKHLWTTPLSWQYSMALTSSINHFRDRSSSMRLSLLMMSNRLPFSAYSIIMYTLHCIGNVKPGVLKSAPSSVSGHIEIYNNNVNNLLFRTVV